MFSLTRAKRRFNLYFAKLYRGIRNGIWSARKPKTHQDRLILKVVRSVLEKPEIRLYYSPLSSKIYIHTPDKKIIIIFGEYEINITNHKFFFSSNLRDGLGNMLMEYAKERIAFDMLKIQEAVSINENTFLSDLHQTFNESQEGRIKLEPQHEK